VTEDEIEDRIEAWHEGEGPDGDLPEFLGWTEQEYNRYVETGEIPRRAQA